MISYLWNLITGAIIYVYNAASHVLSTIISYLINLVSRPKSRTRLKTPTPKEKQCRHLSEPSTTPRLECKAEQKAYTKYRWTLILGLFLPFALGALDATIIASALPWIAADFGEFSQLNWIISAFNLTSAAFIPCWAQMADVFGRNISLNAAIILMIIGNALATGAPTTAFWLLLLGRAIQGISAAGINVVIRTILADKVSLQENARNWAIFSLVGGISYGIGPVVGGYLTRADWRWCFGINLPVGAFALIVSIFVLRKHLLGPQPIPELDETHETGRKTRFVARLKTFDVGGQVLFILGFGLIILAMTWGGVSYPWASAAVVVSLVFGCIFACGFVCWEYLLAPANRLALKMPWQKAMIPWNLMSNRDIGLLFYGECGTGIAMYAVLYFCNIYFIAVKGYTSDEAGVQLLFFTPGLGVGVVLCGLSCNRWPRMTFPAVFLGTLIETIGIGLLGWAIYADRIATIYGMMALVGCGTGLRFMAAPLHGIGLFKQLRASVIAILAVAVPFGGTIGLTIMAAVFNNMSGLDTNIDFTQHSSQSDDLDMDSEAMGNAKMGVVWAFVSITPLVALGVVGNCFLGNVRLGQGPPDEDGPTNIIINGIYLLTLFKGERPVDEEQRGINMSTYYSREVSDGSPSNEPMLRN